MGKLLRTSFSAVSVLMMAMMFNVMSNEPVPKKEIIKNGWKDISQYRMDLQKADLSTKKLQNRARKNLIGKTVRFNGYVQMVGPNDGNKFQYFLSENPTMHCLPVLNSEKYCGKHDPNYFGVLFNGTTSERDREILQSPHDNKYVSKNGELAEKTFDGYDLKTFEKPFHVQAKIKDIDFHCANSDCNEKTWTVQIDNWKFTRVP